jgi:hypothetical protein
LRLTGDGREHLFRLAGAAAAAPAPASNAVDPALTTLMAAWPNNPALIYDCAYYVLASNAIADALFRGWPHSHNLLQVVFADPVARSFYVDWDERWNSHDVRGKSLRQKRFHHADVGEIMLTMQAFDVRSSPGQELVVYRAEPESPSADAVALLGSLAASVGD